MKKLLRIINERKIHYIGAYAVGYILPLIMDGVPSLIYYFPIKLFPIAMAIGLGNASYYAKPNIRMIQIYKLSLKYESILVLLAIVGGLLQHLFFLKGVDISPFIGLPRV